MAKSPTKPPAPHQIRRSLQHSAAPIVDDSARSGQPAREKRALMRAEARRIVAERGLTDLHMRELASRCGVSPQTLYNNLGSRDEILASAIDELLMVQISRAHSDAVSTRTNFMLVFCDLNARLAELDADYIRSIVTILMDPGRNRVLAERIEGRCILAYREHLAAMQAKGSLRNWVDVNGLANILQDIIRTGLTNWHLNRESADWLRHELTLKVGLPLLGVACGEEARRIELALMNSTRARSAMSTPRSR